MRLILAGQRSFGVAALTAIDAAGHDVAAVVAPFMDKLHQAAGAGSVYNRIDSELVRELDVDLIVAAHSHDFISRKALQATRLGGIGYHPSLLPRHRGRDAVRWTVHMGDPIAGGSVYWLTDNVDGGPIAAQDWCFSPVVGPHEADEAVSTLWARSLFPMGVRLLSKVLADLDSGVMVEVPQEEWAATWEPSWERPPLFRPELPQIGSGINGFKHVTTKGRA